MGQRLGLVAAACVVLSPALALGAEGDYEVENQGWNGLSRFVALLEGDGYTYSVEKQLDWDSADTNDILVFIYPLRQESPAPEPGLVADFLHRGGRVLIADDFGAAGGTFSALGISRVAAPPAGLDAYSENPALPFAEPVPGHSLGAGVDFLLTNHPTAFHSELTPAFVFGKPPASPDPDVALYSVVVEGGLDDGRIIAVGDPSLFINAMISYEGNETFAHNLFYHLAGPAPGRGTFRIFVGKYAEWGQGGGQSEPLNTVAAAAAVQDFLRAFNDWLAGLGQYGPKGELSRLMAALLVFSAFSALLARLAQAPTRYDGHWLGGEGVSPGALATTLRVRTEGEDVRPLAVTLRLEVEAFLKELSPPLTAQLPGDRKRAERRVQRFVERLVTLSLADGRWRPERLFELHQEWLALLTEAKTLDLWRRRVRG